MMQPGWAELDNKEKDLCQYNNLKPDEYLSLKKQLQIEFGKNKTITENMIKEKGKDLRNIRDKVPVIYEFWVKTNFIQNR